LEGFDIYNWSLKPAYQRPTLKRSGKAPAQPAAVSTLEALLSSLKQDYQPK
jgi:hypothetical protein